MERTVDVNKLKEKINRAEELLRKIAKSYGLVKEAEEQDEQDNQEVISSPGGVANIGDITQAQPEIPPGTDQTTQALLQQVGQSGSVDPTSYSFVPLSIAEQVGATQIDTSNISTASEYTPLLLLDTIIKGASYNLCELMGLPIKQDKPLNKKKGGK
jgi:hypothetical protein